MANFQHDLGCPYSHVWDGESGCRCDAATKADKAKGLGLALIAFVGVLTLLVAFCITGPHGG